MYSVVLAIDFNGKSAPHYTSLHQPSLPFDLAVTYAALLKNTADVVSMQELTWL